MLLRLLFITVLKWLTSVTLWEISGTLVLLPFSGDCFRVELSLLLERIGCRTLFNFWSFLVAGASCFLRFLSLVLETNLYSSYLIMSTLCEFFEWWLALIFYSTSSSGWVSCVGGGSLLSITITSFDGTGYLAERGISAQEYSSTFSGTTSSS